MEIYVLSLQELDELQLSHLWHFNVRMTSAATEGNAQSSKKLRFVIVTFWASADWNKLELDELECAIKSEVGEQNSRGVEPAALTPCGTVDFLGSRFSKTRTTIRTASLPSRQRRPESKTAATDSDLCDLQFNMAANRRWFKILFT